MFQEFYMYYTNWNWHFQSRKISRHNITFKSQQTIYINIRSNNKKERIKRKKYIKRDFCNKMSRSWHVFPSNNNYSYNRLTPCIKLLKFFSLKIMDFKAVYPRLKIHDVISHTHELCSHPLAPYRLVVLSLPFIFFLRGFSYGPVRHCLVKTQLISYSK